MRETNVLFLGGAKRVSLAEHLIRTGMDYGLHIRIFSYELEETVPIASVGKVIIGKRWKDPDLLPHLKSVIAQHNIQIVLPFVDPATAVVASLKPLIPTLFLPVSSRQICETMFNKISAADWFERNGIPQPDRYTRIDNYHYPVILKPVYGSASKGIVICRHAKDLPSQGEAMTTHMAQFYIEHRKEYTVDCYVRQDGMITSIVPRIRLETAGGEVTKSQTIRHQKIIVLSKRILESAEFRGPITIQFIEDIDTGEIFVMEINPRLGGGVITSIEARSRLLDSLLKEYMGKEDEFVDDWEEGLLLTRYFKEVVFHASNH